MRWKFGLKTSSATSRRLPTRTSRRSRSNQGFQPVGGDKLKALELLMKHLGLAAPEQYQYLHQHVHFTPEQLTRMTDEQLDRTEGAHTEIVTLEQEVAGVADA